MTDSIVVSVESGEFTDAVRRLVEQKLDDLIDDARTQVMADALDKSFQMPAVVSKEPVMLVREAFVKSVGIILKRAGLMPKKAEILADYFEQNWGDIAFPKPSTKEEFRKLRRSIASSTAESIVEEMRYDCESESPEA